VGAPSRKGNGARRGENWGKPKGKKKLASTHLREQKEKKWVMHHFVTGAKGGAREVTRLRIHSRIPNQKDNYHRGG